MTACLCECPGCPLLPYCDGCDPPRLATWSGYGLNGCDVCVSDDHYYGQHMTPGRPDCMSDLQPATLRALALRYADLAEWHDKEQHVDDKGRPKSYYAKRDAGFALGWALRLESQGHRGPARPTAPARPRPEPAPNSPENVGYQSDDDIPF